MTKPVQHTIVTRQKRGVKAGVAAKLLRSLPDQEHLTGTLLREEIVQDKDTISFCTISTTYLVIRWTGHGLAVYRVLWHSRDGEDDVWTCQSITEGL